MWMFYDNSRLAEAIESASQVSNLLRISSDAMLDPQVLVEAVRSEARSSIWCTAKSTAPPVVTSDCLARNWSGTAWSKRSRARRIRVDGRLRQLRRHRRAGSPDGIPYHSELLGDLRYYDIRATQASQDFISLTWRDVTERSELTARIALSEERFRLLADNVADVVVHPQRDDQLDIPVGLRSPGARPATGSGVRAEELIPPEDRANFSAALAAVDPDGRYRAGPGCGAPTV